MIRIHRVSSSHSDTHGFWGWMAGLDVRTEVDQEQKTNRLMLIEMEFCAHSIPESSANDHKQ